MFVVVFGGVEGRKLILVIDDGLFNVVIFYEDK